MQIMGYSTQITAEINFAQQIFLQTSRHQISQKSSMLN